MSNYEKHQRDYTILATSVVMEEFSSARMTEFFYHKTTPLYFLVRDRSLYHYISDEDKWGRIGNWLEHNSVEDLVAYDKEMDIRLAEYYSFDKQDHVDKIAALEKVHQFMVDFTEIIVLVSDLLLYEGHDPNFDNIGLEIRKKYEHVHRGQMETQTELLEKVEEDLGLEERGILGNMMYSEFKEFSKTGKIPEGLKQRNNFFFASQGADGEKVFSQSEADIKLKEIEVVNNIDLDNLKGQPAFAGVVQGKVRIIRLVEEASALQVGEILVTAMTDPRYVPAMKRAAGFITDEGGITCHAAIVAREMKKPCIIGTKVATSALKTGDYIELDAVKGKIKIIS